MGSLASNAQAGTSAGAVTLKRAPRHISAILNAMNRRDFVISSAATVAAAQRVPGSNDAIRIGLMGTGGGCMYLARLLKAPPGTEIVAACDVYEPRRLAAAEKMGPQAEPTADYRQALDRKDIDAVVIASPDHWHTPMTLDAV